MTGSKAGPWIGGTVVGAIVILLAAWFLGISPQMAHASDTTAQAQAQRDQNAMTETKIAALKKQFVKLDEYKAKLAAARLQLPTDLELAAYQRELATIATAHQVTVVQVSVSSSTGVVPVGAAQAPAPAATDSATTDPSAAAPAAPAGSAVISGFSQIPLSIEVVGTYDNVLAFLNDAQTKTTRLLLVTGLNGVGQGVSSAAGGRPATSPGDLDLVITGSLYSLTDQAAPAPAATDPAAKPALPAPVPGKNPLTPLA